MLFARLGLGCKQPYLFQPNIIKVIKCLEIHANFMPTWLQPRCICCESLLRTVQELQGNMMAGGMLSQSLKGFSWGGLVSSFGHPVFCGAKALQGRSCGLLGPSVPVSGMSESMAGVSWHLGSPESAGVLLCKTTETVVLLQRSGWQVFHSAAGFHVPVSKVCPVILRNELLCRHSF